MKDTLYQITDIINTYFIIKKLNVSSHSYSFTYSLINKID